MTPSERKAAFRARTEWNNIPGPQVCADICWFLAHSDALEARLARANKLLLDIGRHGVGLPKTIADAYTAHFSTTNSTEGSESK